MPKTTPPEGHLSFADAAERVLSEEGKALKYTEIAKRALAQGLIKTESKTPDISMHVTMRSDIKRREQRGEPQRFIFLGNGLFGLVEHLTGAPTKKIRSAVDQVKDSLEVATQDLYRRLTSGDHGSNFETMVADLLIAIGYENVEVIGGKDDQGVDILCEKRDGITAVRVAIQCKCKSLSNKVGPKDVSTLRDNLSTYQCQQGILVTTSELNEPAKAKAKEPGKEPVHYIEHNEILDLFAQHGIGIRSEQVRYYQLDESAYEFLKQ
jgi:restriction endonuclease Mrr